MASSQRASENAKTHCFLVRCGARSANLFPYGEGAPLKSNCFALIAALALIGIVSPGYSEDYTITDLGTLGGIYSYPTGINAKGEVTGVLKAVSGVSYPFIYNGQTMLNLGTRALRPGPTAMPPPSMPAAR